MKIINSILNDLQDSEVAISDEPKTPQKRRLRPRTRKAMILDVGASADCFNNHQGANPIVFTSIDAPSLPTPPTSPCASQQCSQLVVPATAQEVCFFFLVPHV